LSCDKKSKLQKLFHRIASKKGHQSSSEFLHLRVTCQCDLQNASSTRFEEILCKRSVYVLKTLTIKLNGFLYCRVTQEPLVELVYLEMAFMSKTAIQ
jgi:hypothetical protein